MNLTASSAEGWCLTVMEAAACGTPSAALAVGGLPESIEDGVTGLLADDTDELAGRSARIVEDPACASGSATNARSARRVHSWDARPAHATARPRATEAPAVPRTPLPIALRRLARSDTGRAAGLAGAVMAANVIALVFTIVFARLLGRDGYGSLAALVSAFLILSVPGSALQMTVAREVSRGVAAGERHPAAGVWGWLVTLIGVTVGVTIASILARTSSPRRSACDDLPWAAAATLPAGCLWLILSVQRGALQGLQRYRLVGAQRGDRGAARRLARHRARGHGPGGDRRVPRHGWRRYSAWRSCWPSRCCARPGPHSEHHERPLRQLVGRAWAPWRGCR